MTSSFTVNTKEIKSALAHMERVGSKFSKTTMLKISVLPDTVEFGKQGMTRIIKAKTEGLADIQVPAILMKGYIATSSNPVMTFVFSNGSLQCGSSTFTSSAITVETVFNIPENTLPINASRMSVLRFAQGKSEVEIARLGLTGTIKYAKRVCSEKVQKAAELLEDYEVSYEELKAIIAKKINQ